MLRVCSVALAALVIGGGCSSSQPNSGDAAAGLSRADELRELGSLIAAHKARGRNAAPSAAELAGLEGSFPLGVKVLRSGEVEVIWTARPIPEEDIAAGRGGKNVMAYEKKAETSGGLVLLQDGEVKEMTAEEFKAAPKAK